MTDTTLEQQKADLSHAPASGPATATIINSDVPDVTPPPQQAPEVNPDPVPESNPDLQPEIPPVENPDI